MRIVNCLTLLFFILLTGCNKHNVASTGTDLPPAPKDSIIILIKTESMAGLYGSSDEYSYDDSFLLRSVSGTRAYQKNGVFNAEKSLRLCGWDGMKRLVTVKDTYINSSEGFKDGDTIVTRFYYTGTDPMLASYFTVTYPDTVTYQVDSVVCTYNQQRKLVRTSYFTLQKNMMPVYKDSAGSYYDRTWDANGNMVQMDYYVYSTTGQKYNFTYRAVYTYDDKINPFSILYRQSVINDMNTNNQLGSTEQLSTGEQWQNSYSYQYNGKGYPLTKLANSTTPPTTTSLTYKTVAKP